MIYDDSIFFFFGGIDLEYGEFCELQQELLYACIVESDGGLGALILSIYLHYCALAEALMLYSRSYAEAR